MRGYYNLRKGIHNILRQFKTVHLIRADARFLPFRSKVFSKVLCFDVLEHLLVPILLVDELGKLMMHDGNVMLRIPNKWTVHEILLRVIAPLTIRKERGTGYVRHVSFFDIEDLKNLGLSLEFGYTYGGFFHNLFVSLLAVASVFINLLILNPLKKEEVFLRLSKRLPKPKIYFIDRPRKLPFFSYLTVICRLEK